MRPAMTFPDTGLLPAGPGSQRAAGEPQDCAGFAAALAACDEARRAADPEPPADDDAERSEPGALAGQTVDAVGPAHAGGVRSQVSRPSTAGAAAAHPGKAATPATVAPPEDAPPDAIADPLADLTRQRARLMVRGTATLHRAGDAARVVTSGVAAIANDCTLEEEQVGRSAAHGSGRRTETAPPLLPEVGMGAASRLETWPIGASGSPGEGPASGFADRGLRSAGEPPAGAAATISPTAADRLAGALPSLVRTLDIELEPGDLGRIDMRMRLGGKALELELRAHDAVSERVLRSGQERLLTFLSEAGYAVEALAIRPVAVRAAQRTAQPEARSARSDASRGPGPESDRAGGDAPPEKPASTPSGRHPP